MLLRGTFTVAALLVFFIVPTVAEETPSSADPRMSAAQDLMKKTDGRALAEVETLQVCGDYITKFHAYRSGALEARTDEFSDALKAEAESSVDDVEARITSALARYLSADDMRALNLFFSDKLFLRVRTALPPRVGALGIFLLDGFATSHNTDQARHNLELFAQYVSPDDMREMSAFAESDLGRREIAAANQIYSEMRIRPAWLAKVGQDAKDRALVRMGLKGVEL